MAAPINDHPHPIASLSSSYGITPASARCIWEFVNDRMPRVTPDERHKLAAATARISRAAGQHPYDVLGAMLDVLDTAPPQASMRTPRRAPVQGSAAYHVSVGHSAHDPNARPAGTISWKEHLEAYEGYALRYGRDQTADRIAQSQGFSYFQLSEFLGHQPVTWQPL